MITKREYFACFENSEPCSHYAFGHQARDCVHQRHFSIGMSISVREVTYPLSCRLSSSSPELRFDGVRGPDTLGTGAVAESRRRPHPSFA